MTQRSPTFATFIFVYSSNYVFLPLFLRSGRVAWTPGHPAGRRRRPRAPGARAHADTRRHTPAPSLCSPSSQPCRPRCRPAVKRHPKRTSPPCYVVTESVKFGGRCPADAADSRRGPACVRASDPILLASSNSLALHTEMLSRGWAAFFVLNDGTAADRKNNFGLREMITYYSGH